MNEQLEAAVAAFTGTVLVASHDQRLLDGLRLTFAGTSQRFLHTLHRVGCGEKNAGGLIELELGLLR